MQCTFFSLSLFLTSFQAVYVLSIDRQTTWFVVVLTCLFLPAGALKQTPCLKELKNNITRLAWQRCRQNHNFTNLADSKGWSKDNCTLRLDSFGKPVEKLSSTTEIISFTDCWDSCPGGHTQEEFNWEEFSRQFSSWLLPWLALLSQLPYGAELRMDNLMSMFLTLGSPVLAGYTILTTLNGSYVASRFADLKFPNAKRAPQVLSGLQQAPLRIIQEKGLLASLVVLPENDRW